MTATVLSPRGKLKVETRKPKKEEMEIAFTAVEEGKIFCFVLVNLVWICKKNPKNKQTKCRNILRRYTKLSKICR